MADQTTPTVKFLRLPEVLSRTGMSRATLYRRIREGEFPGPEKNGRGSFWPDSVVFRWQQRVAINSDLLSLIG